MAYLDNGIKIQYGTKLEAHQNIKAVFVADADDKLVLYRTEKVGFLPIYNSDGTLNWNQLYSKPTTDYTVVQSESAQKVTYHGLPINGSVLVDIIDKTTVETAFASLNKKYDHKIYVLTNKNELLTASIYQRNGDNKYYDYLENGTLSETLKNSLPKMEFDLEEGGIIEYVPMQFGNTNSDVLKKILIFEDGMLKLEGNYANNNLVATSYEYAKNPYLPTDIEITSTTTTTIKLVPNKEYEVFVENQLGQKAKIILTGQDWNRGVLLVPNYNQNAGTNLIDWARTVLKTTEKPNFVVNLKGQNEYIKGLNPRLTTTTFTFELFVKPNKVNNALQNLAGYEFGNTLLFRTLKGNDDKTNFQFLVNTGNGLKTMTSSEPLIENEWHHLAGVYDGNQVHFYINGKKTTPSQNSSGTASINRDIFISANPFNYTTYYKNRHFNGQIDEVKLWKTAKTASQIRADFYKTVSKTDPNLALYYNFNEGLGNISTTEQKTDFSSPIINVNEIGITNANTNNAKDAWIITQPKLSDLLKPNFTIEFNGQNQYIETAPIPLQGNQFTFESWIYAYAFINPIGSILGRESYTPVQEIALLRTQKSNPDGSWNTNGSPYLQFILKDRSVTSSQPLETGKWTHVAGVYDGQKLKLYIDGQLSKQEPLTGNVNLTLPFYISRSYDNNRGWNGKIDEIKIWKTAKTQLQIQEGMSKMPNLFDSNLLHYYNFDKGEGTILEDQKGNKNGTFNNMNADAWKEK